AMVEETTAASHSLAREAAALNELLAQFSFGDGAPSRRAAAPAAAGPAAAAKSPAALQPTSPARALVRKVAGVFGRGGAAAPAEAEQGWEEF
ncbi:MAG: methyl-accepting chemotaxis protein, partial [Sphingomonadaceae bacterium]|nr:methyl-accepting chemotaxis protein [Sphingomonadaceae bacterium]